MTSIASNDPRQVDGQSNDPGLLKMQMAKKKRAAAHKWSREEDLRLLTFMAEGTSYAEICTLMGLDYNQVAGRKYTLKLEAQCSSTRQVYLREQQQEVGQTIRQKLR